MDQISVSVDEFNEMKKKLNEIELALRLDKKLIDIEDGNISSNTLDSDEFIKKIENESNLSG